MDGFVSSFRLFCHTKDLLDIAEQKDVLLSEQTRLQKDVEEWRKKLEDCQKEGETKQQQLQVLQTEIEETKAKLAQQETVLHIYGVTEKDTLCHSGIFSPGGSYEGSPIGLTSLHCPV